MSERSRHTPDPSSETTPDPLAGSMPTSGSEGTPETGEGVSFTITPETLLAALEAQSRLARQRLLEEQEARQAEARRNFDAMTAGLRAKAEARPGYYRDPVLNRFEPERRKRERDEVEAENEARRSRGEPELAIPRYGVERDYTVYGASRFGRAALEGVAIGPGYSKHEGLSPKNRSQYRKALRAATVASKNLGTSMAKEEFERDPRKIGIDLTRGGGRHGGVAIDPETGKSRYRENDPELQSLSSIERRIIKRSERAYKKIARKHRNEEHYLRNQGENVFIRHNAKQRLQESRSLAPIRIVAGAVRRFLS